MSSHPSPYSLCGSSWLFWFQLSFFTTHCYRSYTLGPTLLKDAPKSHVPGSGSQTQSVPQRCYSADSWEGVSVCSQGAGQASHNCPFLKPVRTLIFKLGRLELHYSHWGISRAAVPGGLGTSTPYLLSPAKPSRMTPYSLAEPPYWLTLLPFRLLI